MAHKTRNIRQRDTFRLFLTVVSCTAVLIAACLLHDVSKAVESEPNPEAPAKDAGPKPGRKSAIGENIQHGVFAAHKILEKGLSLELANLVITHTHASNIRGTSLEASLLCYADFADSDVALAGTGKTMFSQRWHL